MLCHVPSRCCVLTAVWRRYIGVWRKPGGPWKASLWKGENGQKRTLHLGSFRSAMAAAMAYDRAAVAARGKQAKTNFPISEVRSERRMRIRVGLRGCGER
eukprot:3390274-Rhodomonas_salina.1